MADDYRADAIENADGGEEHVKSKSSANTAEMKYECSTTHNQEDNGEISQSWGVLQKTVNEDGSIIHDSDNGQPHNPKKPSKLGTFTSFISHHASTVSTAFSKMLPKTEALEYLEKLVKDGTIAIEDCDKKRKLIENMLVMVPVIGRVKAGKSTLLNALLGKQLLPMTLGSKRGTARNINISFYKSEKTPKLTSECKGEKTVLAKGSKDIYTKLTEVNESARNSKEDAAKGAAISYCLKTSPPHLHNIGKKNPLLVDVPGVNEAGAIKAVRCAAERGVTSGAIYLIVISCRDLLAAENIELLKNVIRQDEDAIKDKRVLIAATQYDANYEEESTGDSQAMQQQVVDSICEMFAGICHKFPSSHIIHVCGKWALSARLLRNNLSDSKLRSAAENQYERYCKTLPPAERGHEIQAMDSVSLADALEEASNIKELESRLNEMIADDSVTIMKQKSKTAHMVETAIEQLTPMIDQIHQDVKAYNIKIEKLSAPLTKLQQLTDGLRATTNGGRRSQLYQDLAKQYKEDLDPSWKLLEPALMSEMEVLKQTCHDKAALSADGKADYLPEIFEQDVTDFLEKNIAVKLRDTVLKANIDSTEEICSKHVEQVYETSEKMTEQLSALKEKSSQVPQPAAGQEERGGVRTVLDRTDVRLKDIKNVAESLPPIPLWTGWVKFKILIRVAFTKINSQLRHEGDPQNLKETMRSKHSKLCVSTESVEELFPRVTTHVLAECRGYIFGDSRGSCLDVVVEHYCNSYKEKVDQVLRNYRDCHDDSIKEKKKILAEDQDSKKKADRALKGYEEKKKKLVEYKRSLAAM